MTDNTKDLYEKLNVTIINKDELNKIIKDRMDFGFDSIYFRYAAAIDELAILKEEHARRSGNYPFNRETWANNQKQHFYCALEQLLQAHKEDMEGKMIK
jgi:hypothetical protein